MYNNGARRRREGIFSAQCANLLTKGNEMKKISKLVLTITAIICLAAFCALSAGCKKNNADDNSPIADGDCGITGAATVQSGETYTPEVFIKNGVKIGSVVLTDKDGRQVELGTNYSFEAYGLGVYTYKAVFVKGNDKREVALSVTVKDEVAPVIEGKIADKNGVEIGYYNNFAADLAALNVTDNYDTKQHIAAKVKSISFGGTVFDNSENVQSFFLDKIGEYTVNVEVSDRSGNKTITDYKINTADTTAPIIKRVDSVYAWAGESVKIPTPEVYEIGEYELTATVKSGEKEIPLVNGAFNASETGVYTVTYTARDSSGNVSAPVTSLLNVIARGTVADFGNADEADFWQADNNEKYVLNDKMVVYGDGNGAVERQNINADWSEYKTITLIYENYKASNLSLRLFIKQNGGYVSVCDIKVDAATSSGVNLPTAKRQTFNVDLTGYGLDLSAAEAIKIGVLSKGAYKIGLEKITLGKEEIVYAKPSSAIDGYTSLADFSSDLAVTKSYNGGIAYNTDEKYILTGSRSAKISLAPGDYAGAEFSPITVKNDGDTIAAYVYSAVYARIKLGVKLDSDQYESSVFSLKPGWNKVEWLIGAENQTSLKKMKLSEFTIRSQEGFSTVVYVDGLGYINRGGFTDEELFIGETTFGAAYGDEFIIPSAFNPAYQRYISSYKVAVLDGISSLADVKNLENYGFDENTTAEGLYAARKLESGKEYTLVYVVNDVYGEEHIAVYPLYAEKNVLDFTLTLPTFFVSTEYDLSKVQAFSDVYNDDQLNGAELEVYYKKDGFVKWTNLNKKAFVAKETGFYQFKYVLKCKDSRAEHVYREFIHGKGVVADFELQLSGNYYGFGLDYSRDFAVRNDPDYDPEKTILYLETQISEEWSYDGDRSLKYVTNMTGWGGFWLFDSHTKLLDVTDCNGFSVVINATQPTRGARFSIMTEKGWVFSKEVDIQSGVHRYTIEVSYTDENTDEKTTYGKVGGLIFFIPYDPTKTYYFDSLSYVHVDADSVVEV